jgi:hypothetical protein
MASVSRLVATAAVGLLLAVTSFAPAMAGKESGSSGCGSAGIGFSGGRNYGSASVPSHNRPITNNRGGNLTGVPASGSWGHRDHHHHHRHFRRGSPFYGNYVYDACDYYHERAIATYRAYWWRRYENCTSGLYHLN